jgi:hypothetical protein
VKSYFAVSTLVSTLAIIDSRDDEIFCDYESWRRRRYRDMSAWWMRITIMKVARSCMCSDGDDVSERDKGRRLPVRVNGRCAITWWDFSSSPEMLLVVPG